jgi:hypothetical protein
VAGEHVQQLDGSTGVVVRLHVVSGTAVRYNLTVADVHTFAVGTDQWVVHNCGGHTFTDEDNLLNHFSKHGAEVGADDPLAYQQQASDFFDEASNARRQARYMASVASDGRVRVIDTATGRFIAMTSDGRIITYFRDSRVIENPLRALWVVAKDAAQAEPWTLGWDGVGFR